MRTVIADSLLQMFSPVESHSYPALAYIPASAGAAVEALRSNSTGKSCISHLARSQLKVREHNKVTLLYLKKKQNKTTLKRENKFSKILKYYNMAGTYVWSKVTHKEQWHFEELCPQWECTFKIQADIPDWIDEKLFGEATLIQCKLQSFLQEASYHSTT